MEDIRKWFNGKRNYAEGVSLYLKYGQDPGLKKLFTQEAESTFKRQRLLTALEDILAIHKTGIPLKKSHDFTGKKTLTDVAVKLITNDMLDRMGVTTAPENKWPDQRDDIMQSLWLQWKSKFGEMMNLCSRVGDMAIEGINDREKEKEAGTIALRILTLDDECEALYAERDFYLQNGKLRDEAKLADISLDPVHWAVKLANHQRYVRRLKKQLQKEPWKTDKVELLKKHEWAVAEYKKLLRIE